MAYAGQAADMKIAKKGHEIGANVDLPAGWKPEEKLGKNKDEKYKVEYKVSFQRNKKKTQHGGSQLGPFSLRSMPHCNIADRCGDESTTLRFERA